MQARNNKCGRMLVLGWRLSDEEASWSSLVGLGSNKIEPQGTRGWGGAHLALVVGTAHPTVKIRRGRPPAFSTSSLCF